MTTTALSETPDSPAALVKRWRDEAVTHENRAKELSYGYPILADTHEKKAAQKMECANQLESALASAEPVCYASEEMLRPLREGDENSAEVILWREKGHIHNVAIYAHANAQPAAKVEALSKRNAFPPDEFESWFNEIWAGTDNRPLPEWQKEGWNEYIAEHQLALGAWMAALDSSPTPASVPDVFREHGNSALAHISNALDDLESSPDQRPVPLLNEAMFHIREMLSPTNQEGAAP